MRCVQGFSATMTTTSMQQQFNINDAALTAGFARLDYVRNTDAISVEWTLPSRTKKAADAKLDPKPEEIPTADAEGKGGRRNRGRKCQGK